MENWIDIGSADELSATPLKRVTAMNREFAVSYKDTKFGVLSNTCNHVGGPLGKGKLDGEYIVCPWHNWKFHRCNGKGEPGFEDDCVPAYQVKVENGRVLIDLNSATKRHKKSHARDFDAIRDMLADEVRLDLVAKLQKKGRTEVVPYFDNYARLGDWNFVPGLVDGIPAALVRNPSDPTGKLAYFILLQWEGDRVANIRDFRFARYANEGAELLVF